MDLIVSVDDKAGAFAKALGQFIADVHGITGPGAGSVAVEVEQTLLAAVKDLLPAFSDFSATKDAVLAHKAQFGIALGVELGAALGV